MASNMIHYAISKRISEQIDVGDEGCFFLGATIAPDASSHNDGSYDIAHFGRRLPNNSLKGIDWTCFEKEYGDRFGEDGLYLGYWCHLIQDAIWYHDVMNKYIRIYPKDIKQEYLKKGYADYGILNYLLKKEYGLKIPSYTSLDIQVKEIRQENIETIYEAFRSQFEAKEGVTDALEVYKWDIVNAYMDKCVEVCVNEIKSMRGNGKRINPMEYFVTP
ncbi:MAG TPA: hypothetical protein VJY54_09700 [Lachnospiraceae bacterium]|nr:hypothetical protein [Lachnospiraceae bacterium]